MAILTQVTWVRDLVVLAWKSLKAAWCQRVKSFTVLVKLHMSAPNWNYSTFSIGTHMWHVTTWCTTEKNNKLLSIHVPLLEFCLKNKTWLTCQGKCKTIKFSKNIVEILCMQKCSIPLTFRRQLLWMFNIENCDHQS